MTAVRGSAPRSGQRTLPGGSGKQKKPSKKQGNMTKAEEEEMKASGLCFYHFRYADNAMLCRKPCTWREN